VFAGDFDGELPISLLDALATCFCDLAVQFRSGDGGIVLDRNVIANDLLTAVKS